MGSISSARIISAAALLGVAGAATWWLGPRARYSFRDKSVLITGGSRGFGLLMARLLAAEGAQLFIVARNEEQLREAERDLTSYGVRVRAWVCDVRDAEAITQAVDRVIDEIGRIDVLINNAGIIEASPLEHTSEEDYADSLHTHFWAPFHAMHAALPDMRRRREGRIINIASIGGRIAVPHLNPYAVGKAALVALSEGVRAEVAKYGIVVTTATPGLMRTGSHVNVDVRGQHRREAQMFGLMVSTPLTSMGGERSARQVIEASRAGRAQVTTGWQAKAATRVHALAPELTAAIMAAVVEWLLPGPTSAEGDLTRRSRDIDVGWIGKLFPNRAAVRNNETVGAHPAT